MSITRQKKHKNQNESQIRYLERMLKTASVISDHSREDEVGMDDIVEVEFEEDGEIEKYKLVTSIQGKFPGKPCEHRVSHRQGAAGTSGGETG